MGASKQELDKTYSSPPDTSTCQDCIAESGLIEFVYYRGQPGECSYCREEKSKICSLEELVPHIDECIRMEYTEASRDFLPYDQETNEYVGDTYTSEELLRHLGLDDGSSELFDDIADCLQSESWCSVNGLHESQDEEYLDAWKKFVKLVQREYRYTFLFRGLNEDDDFANIKTVSDLFAAIVYISRPLVV